MIEFTGIIILIIAIFVFLFDEVGRKGK